MLLFSALFLKSGHQEVPIARAQVVASVTEIVIESRGRLVRSTQPRGYHSDRRGARCTAFCYKHSLQSKALKNRIKNNFYMGRPLSSCATNFDSAPCPVNMIIDVFQIKSVFRHLYRLSCRPRCCLLYSHLLLGLPL